MQIFKKKYQKLSQDLGIKDNDKNYETEDKNGGQKNGSIAYRSFIHCQGRSEQKQ